MKKIPVPNVGFGWSTLLVLVGVVFIFLVAYCFLAVH